MPLLVIKFAFVARTQELRQENAKAHGVRISLHPFSTYLSSVLRAQGRKAFFGGLAAECRQTSRIVHSAEVVLEAVPWRV